MGRGKKIIREICNEFLIHPKRLLSDKRDQETVCARQEAYRRLRTAGFSYPKIGQMLNRDHATVFAGAKRAEERLNGTR